MACFPRIGEREEAEIVAAIRRSDGGKTINGLARELNHAHKLIERIVREHQLTVAPRKLVTPPIGKSDEIERLVRLGWADVEIADKLKLPRHAVNRAKERLGLRGRFKPPAEPMAKARVLAADGASIEAIVFQTGIPPRHARRVESYAVASKARAAADSVWLPAGPYRDAMGNVVFLASAAMYRLHDASLLSRVAARAGIEPSLFDKWRQQLGKGHWLFAWLRGERPPDRVMIKLPSRQRRMTRPQEPGEFFVTDEQQAFRREAMPAAIEKAAACQRGRWVRRFPELSDWMLKGAGAPMKMLTEGQARRLAMGWKVRTIVDAANLHRQTFDEIRDRLPRQGFAYWLTWLFGGDAPDGWEIVAQSETGKRKIRPAAGQRTGVTRSGAVAPGRFVASPSMMAFRAAARKLRAEQRLVEIEKELSPEVRRRLLCAFVLQDVPAGKRILADEKTFADPNGASGEGEPLALARSVKTGRGRRRGSTKNDARKDEATLVDFRASGMRTLSQFARARGWNDRELRDARHAVARAKVARSMRKKITGQTPCQ